MNINSLPSQWEMGEQGGSRSSTHTEASECKAVRQHGKFFRIYRGRWYGAFEKSSRRGKSMGESVPGNKIWGQREDNAGGQGPLWAVQRGSWVMQRCTSFSTGEHKSAH